METTVHMPSIARTTCQDVEICIAPNGEADILMHPPKVTGTMEGALQLEFVGDLGDGSGTLVPVDRMARLYDLDLVLATAGDTAYLMTGTDVEAHRT